ncbi:MAG: AAA family ATPase [Candidatus Odinarchaeum yellowstonii]|uniref:AAA family ATPase n=1 Tax=Odinarchaeota yellowstonii (strain LCB_4) TaxID=1841599 RepID=A0AAF0D309_ODILC|nr:MAG: AAA family ATPase [Candidatus Odinarchaeum yellowstonii]
MKHKKDAVDIVNESRIGETVSADKTAGASLPVAKKVVLRPVGYPLRTVEEGKSPEITTDDAELFSAYATDQWNGTLVKKNSFLFDQYIYPDFAFKVVSCKPKEGHITYKTKIILENTVKTPSFSRVKVSMDDIIGQSKAKEKCLIIKKYLLEPAKFGEWAPKNVLFYGPPGTGKTMMALALANETKAGIFLSKATDLIGAHVGGGARRIHQLFENAVSLAPSIIFIDELDAIGLDRRFQSIRGDVSEVVNALLSELDGLNPNLGVVTIGATNAPDILDPALRSRFEDEIEFTLPTREERVKLIELYASRLPYKIEIDAEKVADLLEGFSGRDIKEKFIKALLHKAIIANRSIIDSKMVVEHLKSLISFRNERKPKQLYM